MYSGCTAHPKKQLSRQSSSSVLEQCTQVHSQRCPLGKRASGNEYCPHAIAKSEASAKLTRVSVPL